MAACVAACLAPTTALADANPNNQGHHYHYGWANHHSPPPAPNPAPKPAPKPGPSGGNKGGVTNDVAGPPSTVGQSPVSGIPPALPVFQPPSTVTTTVVAIPSVPDAWLVAILLGAAVAANVAVAVWLTGRGGHLALRRALAPVGVRI